MSSKSIFAFAIVLASLVACGAPPETDEPDESASDDQSSAMSVRDDMPAPVDRPMPVPDLSFGRRVPWDLRPYLDELQQRRGLGGGCVLHYVKIYDPSRGHEIEVPVTVCN